MIGSLKTSFLVFLTVRSLVMTVFYISLEETHVSLAKPHQYSVGNKLLLASDLPCDLIVIFVRSPVFLEFSSSLISCFVAAVEVGVATQ